MIIGVGVDIEAVKSFRDKSFQKDHRFFERVFSESELKYCKKFSDSSPRLAARFCAKEAAVKAASSVAKLTISDVEVGLKKNGAPYLQARTARPEVKKLFQKYHFHLSLSHTTQKAAAFVVLEKKQR